MPHKLWLIFSSLLNSNHKSGSKITTRTLSIMNSSSDSAVSFLYLRNVIIIYFFDSCHYTAVKSEELDQIVIIVFYYFCLHEDAGESWCDFWEICTHIIYLVTYQNIRLHILETNPVNYSNLIELLLWNFEIIYWNFFRLFFKSHTIIYRRYITVTMLYIHWHVVWTWRFLTIPVTWRFLNFVVQFYAPTKLFI